MSAVARWFPTTADDSPGWRLDVVTLLAVIGESSISDHSQTLTASMPCLLPRIIPAPQALLRADRPVRMPSVPAKIVGVQSGVVIDSLSFFANIIQPLQELESNTFKAIEIRYRGAASLTGSASVPTRDDRNGTATVTGDSSPYEASTKVESAAAAPRQGPGSGIRRRGTKAAVQDFVTLAHPRGRPVVPARLLSPIHFLSFFSFFLTVSVMIAAGVWHDGVALLGVGLMSLASSVIGYASWWQPELMARNQTNEVPPGDLMIRTREGAFLYVRCTEDVARELFTGTEKCRYRVAGRLYRLLMGLGTVMLMISVVLLGNCTFWSQVFIGVSYIVLNGCYWAMGLLPQDYFWDLSRYEWETITGTGTGTGTTPPIPPTPVGSGGSGGDSSRGNGRGRGQQRLSFTDALWHAIRETRSTDWVKLTGAAPDTAEWRQWLAEAEEAARRGERNWDAVGRKNELIPPRINGRPNPDLVKQHAPAVEVNDFRPQPRANTWSL